MLTRRSGHLSPLQFGKYLVEKQRAEWSNQYVGEGPLLCEFLRVRMCERVWLSRGGRRPCSTRMAMQVVLPACCTQALPCPAAADKRCAPHQRPAAHPDHPEQPYRPPPNPCRCCCCCQTTRRRKT